MSTRRCILGILLFGLAALLLSGCGRKGPLQPLLTQRPQPVEDAQLLQRGSGFQLRWRMPTSNLAGTGAADIDLVEIERLISTAADYCSECPDPWPRIARVDPRVPSPAQQVRNLFLLQDADGRSGYNNYYRLRVRNLHGYVSPTLTLQQIFREPIPAPQGLQGENHDRSVELSWQPAAVPDGATLLGYQVYRRRADQPFSPLPTNVKPLQTTSFSDFGLKNGQSYTYRVRSLFDFSGEQVESLPGSEVSTTPNAG